MPSIALGSLFIECNHLGGAPATLATFDRGGTYRGDELLALDSGTVGGMLRTLREARAEIRPLLVTSGCPSGPVTADCYAALKSEMLQRLRQALPVDGVLMALHGAAAADNAGDLEGDLLAAIRELIGPKTPLVATLDLHAHVTREMITAADALLAWETYPHRDALETGNRGARAILDILAGRLVPTMAMAKVPVIVGAILGHTDGPGPFADVMRAAKALEREPGVYSASAFHAHPYLDLPEMGGGGLVITHNDLPRARKLATGLAEMSWQSRRALEVEVIEPEEAVHRGLAGLGMTLLVEAADCCGGGAAGDAVAALKALLKLCPHERALFPVVDPAAAAECHRAGLGATVSFPLGHAVDPKWGQPVQVTGVVERLSDGAFTYRGGIWEGQQGQMGQSARLKVGRIEIAVATHPTYEWLGEQYDALEMDPAGARFVVVKNPMNYRMRFRPLAQREFILESPGPTPASLRRVKFQRLQRPYFPLDEEIPGFVPWVYSR